MTNLKQLAAERALGRVTSGMILGLGTGSTVQYVLEGLAQRLHSKLLHDILGVPTSEATSRVAQELGIPLTSLDEHPNLDMTIDGADEVDPSLNVIKGLGGALLREKIVAHASTQLVIVVDETKRVDQLGKRAPLPVEVLPFGWRTHLPFLQALGATPHLRHTANGQPYVSDNGNMILDCTFPDGIHKPRDLAYTLAMQPGIVDCGLFLDMTTEVFVGSSSGVIVLKKQ